MPEDLKAGPGVRTVKPWLLSMLACPACRHALAYGPAGLECPGCQANYPETLGIPDLRGAGAASREGDEAIAREMAAHYAQASSAELVRIRLNLSPTSHDLVGHELGYHLNRDGRGERMLDMFQARAASWGHAAPRGRALDVGCGSGGSLLALAARYREVVGIDRSLPDLIIAAKVLEETGVTNVQLVLGRGEALPFADRSFDYINALNVLEHVAGLDGVLGACSRALAPGGAFAADSRNRYDLFLPEPHVKVRWVGLLPRRWAPAYVRWRKGIGYDGTCLHSYRELQRALRRHFGPAARIAFPLVQAYGSPAAVDRWLVRLERVPGLSRLALWVFPSHLALAWRPRSAARPAGDGPDS